MVPHSSFDIDSGRLLLENNDLGLQQSKFSRTRIKFLIFVLTFILSAAVCLTYTFMRPAIYESSASLLLSPDLAGSRANLEEGAAIQDVAVQSQVLLSRELLTHLLEKLSEISSGTDAMPTTLSSLKNMVRVTPVEKSTIVNLRAEGHEKEVLPVIVNTWLELYLEKNSQMQTSKSNDVSDSLQGQILELDNKLAEKKEELNTFRDTFDIVSMQRDENQILSELKGLNTALNKAVENKVTAEANLVAIQEALAAGKWAGRFRKPNELTALEREAEILKQQVSEYRDRYTDKFLLLDKDARSIINRLELLEEKILLMYEENRIAAVESAEQEILSAKHAVADIHKKLAANKKKTALFSKRFAEYESLQEELAQLEKFSRDLKEELVAMEIKSSKDIIQVKLLERAFPPERPIRPDYLRDAAISIALSILFGIFAVLFFDLFTRPSGEWSAAGAPAISYNRPYQNPHPLLRSSEGIRPGRTAFPELEHKMPREMAEREVQALMSAADNQTQLLITVILHGLSLVEAAGLKWGDIQDETKTLHVAGEYERIIPATNFFRKILGQNAPQKMAAELPIFQDMHGNSLTDRELESLLAHAAKDAGLALPTDITGQVLRHTYISFLVRQGGRLTEITKLTGPLPSAYQAAYELIRPPGPGIPLAEIQLEYPLKDPEDIVAKEVNSHSGRKQQ